MKILMVCLGNICRSPLAEGIMRHKIAQKGLNWEVDSAGTGGWHAGEKPDKRSIATGLKYGIDISQQRARQFKAADFAHFDHILVMDDNNFRDIQRLATQEADKKKVHRILDFHPSAGHSEVPDPYYDNRFELVYSLLDGACQAFIEAKLSRAEKK